MNMVLTVIGATILIGGISILGLVAAGWHTENKQRHQEVMITGSLALLVGAVTLAFAFALQPFDINWISH